MKKRYFAIGAAVLMIAGALIVPRFMQQTVVEEIDNRPRVVTQEIILRDIETYTSQIGSISPAESVSVIPKASGEIIAINVAVGDEVAAGDELATISVDSLSALKLQVDNARIGLSDAQKALARTTELSAVGAVSQAELEAAQSAASMAKIGYETAKNQYDLNLKYSHITSPIAGVIEAKNIDLHDVTGGNMPAFVISAKGGMKVTFGITDEVYESLELGEAISIERGDITYKGHITEISKVVSEASGLHTVEASIEGGEDLANGLKVKVTVPKAKVSQVLSIPVSAIYYSAGDAFVYVLQDGKAVLKKIETGIYDAEYMEVKSGLESLDVLIGTWSSELYDGAEVIEASKAE